MDFFQRVTVAVLMFRLMVMLIGVTTMYVAYGIFKPPSGRMPILRRVAGAILAAVGVVIILAGLLWPIPVDWARVVTDADGTTVLDPTRSPQ